MCRPVPGRALPLQVAVCNLASISLKAFAKQQDGATGKDAFDHQKLFEITKVTSAFVTALQPTHPNAAR